MRLAAFRFLYFFRLFLSFFVARMERSEIREGQCSFDAASRMSLRSSRLHLLPWLAGRDRDGAGPTAGSI
jgi:hypothetical protein